MFKSINLVKISSTALLNILVTGALISQSAMAAPVRIDSLDTTRVPATPRSSTVCDGANCAIKNYGTGTNIRL